VETIASKTGFITSIFQINLNFNLKSALFGCIEASISAILFSSSQLPFQQQIYYFSNTAFINFASIAAILFSFKQ